MAARVRAPTSAEARSPLPAMDASDKELQAAFSDVSDPGLLQKLSQLCRTYGLSAEDLQTKWELVCVTDPLGNMKMSVDTLPQLEARCSAGKPGANPKAPSTLQASRAARPMSTFTKDTAHLLQAGMLSTITPQRAARPTGAPISPLLSASPSSGSPSGTFASRQDSGKVVHTANPLLGPAAGKVQLEVESEPAIPNTRFMWEKMEDRARLLDEGVAAFEQELMHEEGLPPLRSVTTTGEEMTVAGRVCGEVEGRLNAKSVFLEGSRARSNGFRVRLDLSQCAEYALFPGQLIGVVGINAAGHTILASRVLTAPRVPQPPPPAEKPAEPFNVMTAAGPFCCTDDLTYAPLVELLKEANTRHASLLVLHGPFVDEMHPTAGSAELSVSFQDLFEQHVLERVQSFVEEQVEAGGAVTQVVLLPSVRDVFHSPVFPQPPLGSGLRKAVRPFVRLLPNPSTFRAGGYTFAGSSLDAMMLLTQQELSKMAPPQPGQPRPERLSRLASHLLRQRRFLPLFPASADASVAVDVVANLQVGTIGARPHVLLVPSDLGPFAKPADGGVLAVNSGRAARGAGGGTFALFAIHPPLAPEEPAEAAADEAAAPMEVEEEEEAAAAAVPAEAAPADAAGAAEEAAKPAAEPMEGVSETPAATVNPFASPEVKSEPMATGAAEAKPAAEEDEEASRAAAAEAARAARAAEDEATSKAHDILPRTFVEIVRI